MLCLIFLMCILFETPVLYGVENDVESEEFFRKIQSSMGTCFDEIFATACGASILGDSNKNDIENQQIAIASTKLWINLSTMVAIQEVFKESAFSVLTENSGASIPKIIRAVFENIETTILNDSALAMYYREEKSKAEKLRLSNLDRNNSNFRALYERNMCFKEFIVRITILLHAFGAHNTYHSLSRAIFSLAKTTERDRVQQIFDEAVKITAAKCDFDDTRMEDQTFVSGMARILFPTIVDLIERLPDLENLFMEHGVKDIRLGTEEKIIRE